MCCDFFELCILHYVVFLRGHFAMRYVSALRFLSKSILFLSQSICFLSHNVYVILLRCTQWDIIISVGYV